MPAVSKRKTYTKRKTSKKSRTNRRLGRWKVRRWLRNKKPYKVAKLINVANNHEIEKKVVKVQKISNKQRNIIRKRFKEGYSPFIDRDTSYFQLVSSDFYNKPNWASFLGLNVYEIGKYFDQFPDSSRTPGEDNNNFHNDYFVSETQSLYIGNVVETLEIVNPTNYDVNLVIYDFIYKDNVANISLNNVELLQNGNSQDVNKYGPIALIQKGLTEKYKFINYNDIQVAGPTNLDTTEINLKPTDSYAFNVYCKIVKKTVYRLQPGASLKHIFVIKPKALINRGYYAYKFVDMYADAKDGIMKDVTYGMLCKTWGQIANSGNPTSSGSNINQVTNLPGNITFKRTREVKWYAMDSKYTYIRNNDNPWTPAETDRPEVVNDESIRVAATMNLDPTDNNNQAQASTSGS